MLMLLSAEKKLLNPKDISGGIVDILVNKAAALIKVQSWVTDFRSCRERVENDRRS